MSPNDDKRIMAMFFNLAVEPILAIAIGFMHITSNDFATVFFYHRTHYFINGNIVNANEPRPALKGFSGFAIDISNNAP